MLDFRDLKNLKSSYLYSITSLLTVKKTASVSLAPEVA